MWHQSKILGLATTRVNILIEIIYILEVGGVKQDTILAVNVVQPLFMGVINLMGPVQTFSWQP